MVTHSAVSAIEMALWDLAGQAAGVPAYKLLGGKIRDRVRAYNGGVRFPMTGQTPQDYAENMAKMKESKFRRPTRAHASPLALERIWIRFSLRSRTSVVQCLSGDKGIRVHLTVPLRANWEGTRGAAPVGAVSEKDPKDRVSF
jgi:L-alanine-DL-glutamate epimerase-like enolase superfamily enzyme